MGVPMIVIHMLEGSVATLTRPITLDDNVEKFLNDGSPLERRTSRLQAVDAIDSGDWPELARLIGVPDDYVQCFEGDLWEAERATFLKGVREALVIALDNDIDVRFDLGLGAKPSANTKVTDDAVSVAMKRGA